MAETASADQAVEPVAQPLAEPGQRGRLDVADRVVERIATIAASEVAGVVPSGRAIDGLVGHRYPKADASVAGRQVRLELDVAVAWPTSLREVTAAVRDRVRQQVEQLTSLQVDVVDVTAATVVLDVPDTQPERRVR